MEDVETEVSLLTALNSSQLWNLEDRIRQKERRMKLYCRV